MINRMFSGIVRRSALGVMLLAVFLGFAHGEEGDPVPDYVDEIYGGAQLFNQVYGDVSPSGWRINPMMVSIAQFETAIDYEMTAYQLEENGPIYVGPNGIFRPSEPPRMRMSDIFFTPYHPLISGDFGYNFTTPSAILTERDWNWSAYPLGSYCQGITVSEQDIYSFYGYSEDVSLGFNLSIPYDSNGYYMGDYFGFLPWIPDYGFPFDHEFTGLDRFVSVNASDRDLQLPKYFYYGDMIAPLVIMAEAPVSVSAVVDNASVTYGTDVTITVQAESSMGGLLYYNGYRAQLQVVAVEPLDGMDGEVSQVDVGLGAEATMVNGIAKFKYRAGAIGRAKFRVDILGPKVVITWPYSQSYLHGSVLGYGPSEPYQAIVDTSEPLPPANEEEVATQPACDVCPNPPGQLIALQSKVDAVQQAHIHDAVDWSSRSDGGSGCVPCGGSAGSGDDIAALTWKRIHRYRDQERRGSFGPGVFSNFDRTLAIHAADGVVEYWDPSFQSVVLLTAVSGTGSYVDADRGLIRRLRFLDDQGSAIMDPMAAITAKLELLDGVTLTFECMALLDAGVVDAGRLTSIAWPDGRAITLGYLRDASEVAGSADDTAWDYFRIVDAYAREVVCSWTTAWGQSVIQEVLLPTGSTIAYSYAGSLVGLNGVTFPDGTTSSFTTHYDPSAQTQVVTYRDAGAEGIHRNKTVYYSVIDWRGSDGQRLITAPNRVRRVENGVGEPSYIGWQERDGQLVRVYGWQGGGNGSGMLTRLDTLDGLPQQAWHATAFDLQQPTSTYTWEADSTYELDATIKMVGRTDVRGRSSEFPRDSAGNIIARRRLNEAGQVLSEESTTYNQWKRPVDHTDAVGRKTHSEYDTVGNLISRTVAYGTADSATTTWTYNAQGQPLTMTDARGNTTSYGYDARGLQISRTDPPDFPGGPAAVWATTYDAAGRVASTIDPESRTAQYTYDERGRQARIDYGDGSYESFTYGTGDNASLLVAQADRNQHVTTYRYDGAGRQVRIVRGADDPEHAEVTTIAYLPGSNIEASRTVAGATTAYEYDQRNRVIATHRTPRSGLDLVDSKVYDDLDRMAYQCDPYGRRTFNVYDEQDHVIRVVKELLPGSINLDSGLSFPDQEEVLRVLARGGESNPSYTIQETIYNAAGDTVAEIDGRGIRTSLTYDAQGRVAVRTEAVGTDEQAMTSFAYDAVGNRTLTVSPRGVRTVSAFNGRNLEFLRVRAEGTSNEQPTWTTYTSTGKVSTVTDALLRTTQYVYGSCCDRLSYIMDPAGAQTVIGYDAVGNVVSQLDANGTGMITAYDARNRPVSQMNGAGEVTLISYDDDLTDNVGVDAVMPVGDLGFGLGAVGSAVAVTDPSGITSYMIYDALGRKVRSIDGRGAATTMRMDQVVTFNVGQNSMDLVGVSSTNALGETSGRFSDGDGHVRIVEDALGNDSVVAYDASGNAVESLDANGVGQSSLFDQRNRRILCVDTAGMSTTYTYDLDGNVIGQTDSLGASSSWVYDELDRRTSEKDRNGSETVFAYDAVGNLLTLTDAEGGMTAYSYTVRNQVETETFPGATGGTRYYTYDVGGRLATRTDQKLMTTTFGYDGANRMVSRSYSTGFADGFTYDGAGRLVSAVTGRYAAQIYRAYEGGLLSSETQVQPGANLSVNYYYDLVGRPVAMYTSTGKLITHGLTVRGEVAEGGIDGQSLFSRSYDDGGRLIATVLANGLVEQRTYLGDNLPRSIAVPGVMDLAYAYDANKRKTEEVDRGVDGERQTFGYDAADRLTAWSRSPGVIGRNPLVTDQQAWSLSAVGDWITTTINGVVQSRQHDAVHATTKVGIKSLSYDANGNLIRDAEGNVYTWDEENRLISVTARDRSEGVSGTARMTYDALGRRLSRTTFGVTTIFLLNGAQVVQERDAKAKPSAAEQVGDGTLPADDASAPVGSVLQMAGSRHLNMQPETEEIPEGWIADKGRALDVRANGLTYGWVDESGDPAVLAADQSVVRDFLPQQIYDTYNRVTEGTSVSMWRYQVPENGTYAVVVVAGDATSLEHINNLTLNGVSLVDSDPYNANATPDYAKGDFDGWAQDVTVTDGYITITADTGALDPTLCFVEIGPKDSHVDQATQDRLAQRIQDATNRTGGEPYHESLSDTRTFVCDGRYIDAPLAMRVDSGSTSKTYWLHANHLYSVQAVTDEAGQVVERYSYDAYGRRAIVGPASDTSVIGLSVGFTGLRQEGELLFARNRYMSTSLGRWISRDPSLYSDGYNLYVAYYVPSGNDPTGLIKVLILVDKQPSPPPNQDPHNRDTNFADGDQTSSQDGKGVPEAIFEHNQEIDKFVAEIKANPRQYAILQERGLVRLGNKKFTGTMDEYVNAVLNDKAKVITQVNGGLGVLTVRIDEERRKGNEVTVFGHTFAQAFNNGKVDMETAKFKLPSGELLRKTVEASVKEHKAEFISCFEDGSPNASHAEFKANDSWSINREGIDYEPSAKFIVNTTGK